MMVQELRGTKLSEPAALDLTDPGIRWRITHAFHVGEYRRGRLTETGLRYHLMRLGFEKGAIDREIELANGWCASKEI